MANLAMWLKKFVAQEKGRRAAKGEHAHCQYLGKTTSWGTKAALSLTPNLRRVGLGGKVGVAFHSKFDQERGKVVEKIRRQRQNTEKRRKRRSPLHHFA